MPVLSIVIPAYNEEKFTGTLLERVMAVPTETLGFTKEIVFVDDGSRDRTGEIARSYPGVRVFTQTPNQGKGMAVRRGIRECSGDYVLVQDADLEYDPNDYLTLLEALKRADAVYGSRVLHSWARRRITLFPGRHPDQSFGPWLAGVLLSLWTALLYGRWISDTLTAYKLFPAAAVKALRIETTGFETDHEITAKLIRGGLRIAEVPISYHPRSAEEGKKIKARDGFVAVWTLWRFRWTRGGKS